jgi:hypothetical protein
MLRNGDYTSCVEWADFNGDGYPDLAAGGWWAAVCVFENRAGILDTIPTWQWRPGTIRDLVCEALVSADLANAHLEGIVDALDGDGQRRLFTLRNRPVQFLDSVTVEGTRVPASGFCFDPLIGWVSFAAPPPSGTGNVVCFYRYSTHPDLAVTNWDPPHGNHLFRNTTPVGAAAQREGTLVPRISAWPNPFSSVVSLQLTASSLPEVRIVDATGRLVRSFPPSSLLRPPSSLTWDGRDDAGRILPSGTYLAIAGLSRLKLVRTAGN